MALDEYSIDNISKIWRLDEKDSPFQYAEHVLEWRYSPINHYSVRQFHFRFALAKQNERLYKWVPSVDWGTVRAWLIRQAAELKRIHAKETYNTTREHHLFEESDVDIVIYQLQKLQKSLHPVHRKTVGRLLRRGAITQEGELFVGGEGHQTWGKSLLWMPRTYRHEGLGGVGNHNKAPRYDRWERARREWQKSADERREERERKEAKALHDQLLLKLQLEHRAKIAAKKKNRKYNRAVIKNREQHGQDYIWW